MARLKAIQALESQEQHSLIEWAWMMERQYPELKLLYAIPNQGAARLKRLQMEGTKRGVPDLCLPVARGEYHALYIEMKRKVGGKLSLEQSQFIDLLSEQGNLAVVCRGWDEARTALLNYLTEGCG